MKMLHLWWVLLATACLSTCQRSYTSTSGGASAIPTGAAYGPSSPALIEFESPSSIRNIPLTPELEIPALVPGYTLYVPSGRAKGVVVIFADGREPSQGAQRRSLNRAAAQRQLATLFVTTANPLEFLFDSLAYLQLDQFIAQAITEHGLPKDALLFAGRALGGTRALKFGEWCAAGHSAYQVRPRAIVVNDSPLDFFRYYKEGQCNPEDGSTASAYANWLQYQMHKNLGGTPVDAPHTYRSYSPYLFELKIHQPLYHLSNVAVRAYIPPQSRGRESVFRVRHDQNNRDAVGLINDLQYLGNQQAEIIVSEELLEGTTAGHCYPTPWPVVDQEGMLDWFAGLVETSGLGAN